MLSPSWPIPSSRGAFTLSAIRNVRLSRPRSDRDFHTTSTTSLGSFSSCIFQWYSVELSLYGGFIELIPSSLRLSIFRFENHDLEFTDHGMYIPASQSSRFDFVTNEMQNQLFDLLYLPLLRYTQHKALKYGPGPLHKRRPTTVYS
jgi:hypothetical protein